MHVTKITLGELADILESATVTARVDAGVHLVTTGRHPALGAWTAIQDLFNLVLLSELPARAAFDSVCDMGCDAEPIHPCGIAALHVTNREPSATQTRAQ